MEEVKVLVNTLAVTIITGAVGILAAYAKLTLKKIELKVQAETAKIEDDKTREMIMLAFSNVKDVVNNAVISAETTMVAELKKANDDGKLTKADGEMVFKTVKDKVVSQVSEDTKSALGIVIGDFDSYVEDLIQSQLAQITGKI